MNENTPQRWVGNLRGSRVATVYTSRLPDSSYAFVLGFGGGADVRLIARREENILKLNLETTGEYFGEITIERETLDHASGTWRFNSGAEGVIDLTRYNSEFPVNLEEPASLDRIFDRERPIGAVTLYRSDLDRLIAEMETLVPKPNITTIRALENGQILIERAQTYLGRKDFINVVRTITISTAEETRAPLRKIINIVLNDDGSNQISVTSGNEIWTEAASSRIEKFTGQFVSSFTGIFRKHGLNINAFILSAMIVWMPDWPLSQRIVVFIIGVAIMLAIAKSHGLVPYNRVYLNPDQLKRPFAKELPNATLAAGAALVTAALSSVPKLFESARQLIEQFSAWIGQ